jgi:hypothetical protein
VGSPKRSRSTVEPYVVCRRGRRCKLAALTKEQVTGGRPDLRHGGECGWAPRVFIDKSLVLQGPMNSARAWRDRLVTAPLPLRHRQPYGGLSRQPVTSSRAGSCVEGWRSLHMARASI